MPALQIDDATLDYETRGEGPPLFLVHSSGLGARQFSRWLEPLSDDRSVIALNLLGYGASGPFDLETFERADDVALVEGAIRELARGPAALFGHSYGGLLALEVAARGQVDLSALALYEPVAFGVLASTGRRTLQDDLGGAEAAGALYELGEGGVEGWLGYFVDFWNGPGAWAAMSERKKAPMRAGGLKAFAEVRSMDRRPTGHDALATVDVPTLLLHGSESPPTAVRVCRTLEAVMPRVDLQRVEGAGHMGPLTHAAEVVRRVGASLSAGRI